eukprot:GHRR01037826.1.p3 GENE.GHRR01037826.1~~GHRR01037826.1.p3  ORF type:complete len:100 (+),score=15.83 GHRR01037826.1:312-611(+)
MTCCYLQGADQHHSRFWHLGPASVLHTNLLSQHTYIHLLRHTVPLHAAGREPGTAPEVAALGEARSSELSALVNNFILRRTNKLLSDHLPPKVSGCWRI